MRCFKEITMLEPVQNCFTFYHPDGISSPFDYSNNHEKDKSIEGFNPVSIVAQKSLELWIVDKRNSN